MKTKVNNIVLVHGAFADGYMWLLLHRMPEKR